MDSPDTKKKLLEAEARCKKLGQKLCEFEAAANSNSDSYEVKYLQANDQLTQKTKKIKDIESALRKSEKHVKELNEQIASSGSGYVSITVLWSIYVVDQLLFSIVSSILTFDFHLIWGSFLTFGALISYFWGQGRFQKLFSGLRMYLNNFYCLCFLQF